jgi:uncharacterized membrane protein YdjX (TVP38/TMEM64 family)
VLTLAGGFLFGSIEGTLFARYIIGAKLQEKYLQQLEKFNKELTENKYQYLFSLRFLPIFPFLLLGFLTLIPIIIKKFKKKEI